jgi:hypothetical protein
MDLFQQLRRGSAVVLILVVTFAGCSRNPEGPHPVETAEEACRIAARHLSALGLDTSRSTEYVRPDYPISLDTLRSGRTSSPGPWNTEENSPYLKAAHGRLNGKFFWLCYSVVRRPASAPGGGPNLVTDNVGNAEVFIDAGTGEVLLTFPQDYYKATRNLH